MKHCQICDRNYSDKNFRKHSGSNKHLKKHMELDVYINLIT